MDSIRALKLGGMTVIDSHPRERTENIKHGSIHFKEIVVGASITDDHVVMT